MYDLNYSGNPFSAVVARVPEDGFGMVAIISPKDEMFVEFNSIQLSKLAFKAKNLNFNENEPVELTHTFNADTALSLDNSSTFTMTIDNHEYPMTNVLMVNLEFDAKVTLHKNALGEYIVFKTEVQDINLENSGFTFKRIVLNEDNFEIMYMGVKELSEKDIHNPKDESVTVKNQALNDIFNSIDFRPLITGRTFNIRDLTGY
jgi:hypothetical protein